VATVFKKSILTSILAITLVASTFTSLPVAFALPSAVPSRTLQSQIDDLNARVDELEARLEAADAAEALTRAAADVAEAGARQGADVAEAAAREAADAAEALTRAAADVAEAGARQGADVAEAAAREAADAAEALTRAAADLVFSGIISNVKEVAVTLCENIVPTKLALDIVSGVTFNLLTATNAALNPLNSILTALKNLSLTIPIPSFTILNVIPTVSVDTCNVAGVRVVCGIDLGTTSLIFDLPNPSITPFGFITTVPTISSNVFESIDAIQTSIEECDPDILNQI